VLGNNFDTTASNTNALTVSGSGVGGKAGLIGQCNPTGSLTAINCVIIPYQIGTTVTVTFSNVNGVATNTMTFSIGQGVKLTPTNKEKEKKEEEEEEEDEDEEVKCEGV